MKVAILCGGKGVRIRDVAGDLPKPMVRVGEYPIVKHIMDIYARHGFKEFVLCLGYQSWSIKEYFLNFRAKTQDVVIDFGPVDAPAVEYVGQQPLTGWSVILAETGLESMTGYRIRSVAEYLGGETFMLTYGDAVGNVDITALLEFHRSHGRKATITAVQPPSRFGQLTIADNSVIAFKEKPQAGGGLINGGFFVCEPEVLDYIPDDPSVSFEREPLHDLAQDGELMRYQHDGFWMPMDTAREYELLNKLWSSSQPPWLMG